MAASFDTIRIGILLIILSWNQIIVQVLLLLLIVIFLTISIMNVTVFLFCETQKKNDDSAKYFGSPGQWTASQFAL